MARVFVSPGKYIQGPGELKKIGMYAAELGEKALLVCSEGGFRRYEQMLTESFASQNGTVYYHVFGGECTSAEIAATENLIRQKNCDVVIGVGGGKVIDTAKAAACNAGRPMILCPTAAASDAPTSAVSVIYTEAGAVDSVLLMKQNPDRIVMDSEVIAKAPVRLNAAGMGDALATYYEARACFAHEAPNMAGGIATQTGMAIARVCCETILREGYPAKLAMEAGVVTPAVEHVIEANTLMSGLGFENSGLAAAHSVHNGLSQLEQCHGYYHGEKVAFGLLVQLVMENAPTHELEEVLRFCSQTGLPITLMQLGIELPDSQLIRTVAKAAAAEGEVGYRMPFEVTAEKYVHAILAADAIGRDFLKQVDK